MIIALTTSNMTSCTNW